MSDQPEASVEPESVVNEPQEEVTTTPADVTETPKESEPEKPAECPLCTYMRAGPCGTEFDAFNENCVKKSEEERDMDQCKELVQVMTSCFVKESEYYSPILKMLNDSDESETETKPSENASTDESAQDKTEQQSAPDSSATSQAESSEQK
eukprot:TRINITY_DN9703_c0_g2_i1.p1 TRINITY_DN9703_c0_g2~~TRINITY_DN9703_c0_g2_i1.p1  ORF type:complete len:151 (-),score=42.22 TRINITY_DN9703_c0_g2_i1:83-535(-)